MCTTKLQARRIQSQPFAAVVVVGRSDRRQVWPQAELHALWCDVHFELRNKAFPQLPNLDGWVTSILWSAFELLSRFAPPYRKYLERHPAIAGGFVAQRSVDTVGHPVAPCDVSPVSLLLILSEHVDRELWRPDFQHGSADSTVSPAERTERNSVRWPQPVSL